MGGLIALVVIGAYVWNVRESGQTEHGRAMAMATLGFASAALTARLSGLRTRTARVIAAATIGSTIIMIQAPLLAGVLHLEPLHLVDWSVAVAGSLLAAALSGLFALRREARPLKVSLKVSPGRCSAARSGSAGCHATCEKSGRLCDVAARQLEGSVDDGALDELEGHALRRQVDGHAPGFRLSRRRGATAAPRSPGGARESARSSSPAAPLPISLISSRTLPGHG